MTEIIILISSVLIGVLLGKFLIKSKQSSKLILTFSGAYFLGITVIEILPNVYQNPIDEISNTAVGLYILLGVLVQIILETVSKGAEHGHVHIKKEESFPLGIFLGLFLHSIIEGIPVANSASHDFLWAIFVHNIPVSMILYTAIAHKTSSWIKQFAFLGLFALAAPFGFLLGSYTDLIHYSVEISAIVAGIFLHISTVILFESSDGHQFNFKKLFVLLFGFLLAYLTVNMHIHSH